MEKRLLLSDEGEQRSAGELRRCLGVEEEGVSRELGTHAPPPPSCGESSSLAGLSTAPPGEARLQPPPAGLPTAPPGETRLQPPPAGLSTAPPGETRLQPPPAGLPTAPPGEARPSTAPPGILLVGKCGIRETGNATTLARLCRYVGGGGWLGVTRDLGDLPDLGSLQHLVRSHNIAAVVGLHAYRSAHVLSACREVGVPYVVVFGGTDMNECAKEATKLEVMRRVVLGARHLVVFDGNMRDLVLATWPTLDPEMMSTLPQAVLVDPCPDVDVSAYLKTLDDAHEKHCLLYNDQMSELSLNVDSKVTVTDVLDKENYIDPSKERTSVKENGMFRENVCCCEVLPGGLKQNIKKPDNLQKGKSITPSQEISLPDENHDLPEIFKPLVLLVAGLRPVKDVLYVADAWSTWHRTRGGRGRLVILGPTLDPDYAAHVHAQAARMSGVRVAPSLPPRECQAIIRSATALVNSSLSESMPSSLLEAMLLGTPVLARDIPGNASLVTHGETGLVFSSPATFLQGLDALLHHPHLKASLVAAAKDRVRRHHSPERERDTFLRILRRVVEAVEPAMS